MKQKPARLGKKETPRIPLIDKIIFYIILIMVFATFIIGITHLIPRGA